MKSKTAIAASVLAGIHNDNCESNVTLLLTRKQAKRILDKKKLGKKFLNSLAQRLWIHHGLAMFIGERELCINRVAITATPPEAQYNTGELYKYSH